MLVKSPLFTGIVVVTLALGIGLNTAVFAVVEAMLLRPVAGVRAPDELVQVYRAYPGDQRFGSSSIPHFWDVRDRTRDVFGGVTAWSFVELHVTATDRPRRIFGQMVSADYFHVLGATPALGRFFVPAEDSGRGAHPVAVLSHAGWHDLFGGVPDIVGRQVLLNGRQVEVVGVARPEFRGVMPMIEPLVWVPLMQLAEMRPATPTAFDNRGINFMSVVARLAPGVTLEQAEARMAQLDAALRSEHPDTYRRTNSTLVRQRDAGIHPTMRDAQRGLSLAVLAVVALLLLLACVNVANLFMARAQDRAREMAIRLSLGARRVELVRQQLVESLCFAAVSGIAGLVVAQGAIALLNRIRFPVEIALRPDLRLDGTVLTFALGASVVTGLLFGVLPALQATRPSLIPALKGEQAAGGARGRVSRALVVAQMALSLVLLTGAGLFLTNLRAATALDKGFAHEEILIAELDPSLQGYAGGRTREFYRRLVPLLEADPRVEAVGLIDNVPLGLGSNGRTIEIPGYVPAENERMNFGYAIVDPAYFGTLGIAVRAGRVFGIADDSAAVRRIVINERFAERFWPGEDAVGRTVRAGGRENTVIGVVATGKYERLGESAQPFMYFAHAQEFSDGMSVVIRTAGPPAEFIPALRAAVGGLDANLPVSGIRTMEGHLGLALLPARLTGWALGLFGALGLVLATVGMYGVMAYGVAQRTREIGIRMAVGAAGARVVGLVMRQGMSLVLVGAVVGSLGALAAARLLRGVLYGEATLTPLTYGSVTVLLVGVAALATYIPARRAAAVDPAITLKAD